MQDHHRHRRGRQQVGPRLRPERGQHSAAERHRRHRRGQAHDTVPEPQADHHREALLPVQDPVHGLEGRLQPGDENAGRHGGDRRLQHVRRAAEGPRPRQRRQHRERGRHEQGGAQSQQQDAAQRGARLAAGARLGQPPGGRPTDAEVQADELTGDHADEAEDAVPLGAQVADEIRDRRHGDHGQHGVGNQGSERRPGEGEAGRRPHAELQWAR